jgi:hypothetical protein
MTTEQLTTLTESAAAYVNGGTGAPVVLAGKVGGEIWLLLPGDGFHLMDTRGQKEATSGGGIVTWSDDKGEPKLVIAPLVWCDEFNRADTEASIAAEREHYAGDEGARWLRARIKDAEQEVAGRK